MGSYTRNNEFAEEQVEEGLDAVSSTTSASDYKHPLEWTAQDYRSDNSK